MLVCALVGGSAAARSEVARKLARLIGAAGVVYSMPPDMPADKRLALLKGQFSPRGALGRFLLLNELQALAEFEWVRSIGGYVVHVDGLPSNVVAMQPHDFYVTAETTERGRFDTVDQCFAALKLHYQLTAEQRSKIKFSETVR